MSGNIDITSVVDTNEYLSSINKKELPVGSVAYYLDFEEHSTGKKVIKYGIVDEHYAGTIALRLLELSDRRFIQGVPLKDFVTPTQWKKLPNGWSYDTVLFEIETIPLPKNKEEIKEHIDIRKPENILWLYSNGVLVDVSYMNHRELTTEIDKNHGWRIIDECTVGKYYPSYVSVSYYNVYPTYEEAEKALKEDYAEYCAQAEMTDYEWSVWQIDHELNRWANIHGITDVEKQRYRDWLLERDNVEDIEIRIADGGVQWKYWKNKKWLNIVV